jgi:hypothetical protein
VKRVLVPVLLVVVLGGIALLVRGTRPDGDRSDGNRPGESRGTRDAAPGSPGSAEVESSGPGTREEGEGALGPIDIPGVNGETTLTGRVLLPGGFRVAGAQVILFHSGSRITPPREEAWPGGGVYRSTTDREGRFVFRYHADLQRAQCGLSLLLLARAPGRVGFLNSWSGKDVEVVLGEAAFPRIRAVDGKGDPLGDVEIDLEAMVTATEVEKYPTIRLLAETDGEGRIAYPSLPREPLRSIRLPRRAGRTSSPGGGTTGPRRLDEPIRVVLTRGLRVIGRVVEPDGGNAKHCIDIGRRVSPWDVEVDFPQESVAWSDPDGPLRGDRGAARGWRPLLRDAAPLRRGLHRRGGRHGRPRHRDAGAPGRHPRLRAGTRPRSRSPGPPSGRSTSSTTRSSAARSRARTAASSWSGCRGSRPPTARSSSPTSSKASGSGDGGTWEAEAEGKVELGTQDAVIPGRSAGQLVPESAFLTFALNRARREGLRRFADAPVERDPGPPWSPGTPSGACATR